MIQEALGKEYDVKRIKYRIADVEHLPFDNESFDTVVDTFSLQSYYDRNKALKEIKRVLKPEGKLLVLGRGISKVALYNQYLQLRAGEDIQKEGWVYHLDFESMFKDDKELSIDYYERKNLGMTFIMMLTKKNLDEVNTQKEEEEKV